MKNNPLCPICNQASDQLWSVAKDIEYFTTDKKYEYWECINCHCLFINPIPENDLNIIYPSDYYSYGNNKPGLINRIKDFLDRRNFKKLFSTVNKDRLALLDIGGGNGWLSELCKNADKRINHVQVVDLDPGAKSSAEQKGFSFFLGSFESFNSEIKYDIILMLNIIEHVKQPNLMLKKASSLLSKDGIIIVKTPNFDSMDARIFKNHSWGGLHCPRHWVVFDYQGLKKIATNQGLMTFRSWYTQGAPFWSTSLIAYLNLHDLKKEPQYKYKLFPIVNIFFAIVDFIRLPFSKTSQMIFILKKDPESYG